MNPLTNLGPLHLVADYRAKFCGARPAFISLVLALLLALSLVACGTVATPTPAPTPTPILVDEPAPIASVDIAIIPGRPPIAELVVVSGLPNACCQFKEHRLIREGNRFTVEIINLREGGELMACAEIYQMVTTRIPLGTEFASCQIYEIIANGESFSAQAIGPYTRCTDPSLPWDTHIKMAIDDKGSDTTILDNNTLEITVLEIIQDYRCPSDAVCIRAGDATVRLRVSVAGGEPDEFDLVLGAEAGDQSVKTVDVYTVELTRLDLVGPKPVSTTQIKQEDYVVWIAASRDAPGN
jgi:hypothetical protein